MRNVIGGGLPARLWRDFMADAHAGLPARALPGASPEPKPMAKAPAPPAPAPPAADAWWRKVFGGFTGGG
jgi:penicillin-binding protein 1A